MLPGWVPRAVVLEALAAPGEDAVHSELLRQWGSSEVRRLSYGLRSVIVKRGSDAQAGEGAAYERYVVPLGLPAPELLYGADEVIVLADVGRVTLEQEPTADGFVAAAELAARIHGGTVDGASGFPPSRVKELAGRIDLDLELEPLVEALDRLHREAPLGVVHGDFVPKNLVTDGTRWTVVDWPLAHLAPHLSDLYTLIRDAVAVGYDRGPIVARYVEVSGADPFLVDRQLLVGGACFCLLALTFVIEEGVRTIPGSEDWIAPLRAELADLVGQLS
ncbi:phosphotransferase family protein [Kribbella sp.]|uniref:phosphotransferase family protein n=1 Tax=Kribbella sp. TaxID=1871183 RepID=UPI002D258E65|nr:phosphotransferase [Kribbella sp.]HZX09076.1 phosphotransferase [Kribbella sp.]